MNIKRLYVLSITFFLVSCAVGVEPDQNKPPTTIELVNILLSNGSYVGDGCDFGNGPTLRDNVIQLISTDGTVTQALITYRCQDDKREYPKSKELVSVWLCSMTGRGLMANGHEVYGTSINVYLNKKNWDIVDALCL